MTPHDQGIARIERAARRAEQRMRLARMLVAVSRSTCAGLACAVAASAAYKLGVAGAGVLRATFAFAALLVVATAAAAWTWRLPARAGARALDRFHGLHDRLSSALDFAGNAVERRTPFMQAAIDDAITAVRGVRPALAVRVRIPRAFAATLVFAAMLAGVRWIRPASHPVSVHARTIDPVEMAPDDLDDVKDFLKQMEQRNPSADTRAEIEEFNRLVEDLAKHRVDRVGAFDRLDALERKLFTGTPEEKKALEERLDAMGDELKKNDLTRPVGSALADDNLARAREAMRDLARKMRSPTGPMDKAKLDQVREALKKAVEQARERQAELQHRRDELSDELLKKKREIGDAGSDEERSLLDKKKQELERLDRDLDQQRDAGQRLDRLDRDLEQAAEDLMKDMGLSANDIDQGAEDLNRMNQEQMSQQEKEELKQKLQELRELLRQQGQGGKGQIVRLERFGRMARGQGQGQSGQQGQGQGQSGQQGQSDGQGQDGQKQSSNAGDGPPGQGQDGQGQPGQGQSGQSNGQAGETWIVGPNGEKILMLSKGSGGGESSGGESRDGEGRPGRWGEGHDPNVQGKATHSNMGTEDTQAQGAASGGVSRSQVILGAAQRGFASHRYEKVYSEYHQVAEESLAKDDIPGGYRFYVKRYFQLIRPRDEP